MTNPVPSRSPGSNGQRNLAKGFQSLEWDETSYTKIPRGWARFCRETAGFLRSIGLGIIVTSFQGMFRKDFSEPKKVTVLRGRVSALLRALIHVPPLAFALLEIIINLRGYYVGEDFDKQSYYQLAAKAHEIAIDASLALIVLSYIRYELTIGDGLPFGAFLGSLQFSQVSYLWSRELWSCLFASGQKLRRLTFFILVMICGVIAATAGPSSATLLIPRQSRWSVEPSYVLFNSSRQDIWPDYLNSRRVSPECSAVSSNLTQVDILCPGASWSNIFYELVATIGTNKVPDLSYDLATSGYILNLGGVDDELFWILVNDCPGNPAEQSDDRNRQTCAASVPFVVTNAAFNDTQMWTDMKDYDSYSNIYHSVTKDIYAPYTAIRCLHDTIQGPQDTAAVTFPSLSLRKEDYTQPVASMPINNLTKAHIYAISNVSTYTLMFTDLPEEQSGVPMSGVILVEPRGPAPLSSQNISMCTFAVGWGTSVLENDYLQDQTLPSASGIPPFLSDSFVIGGMNSDLDFTGPIFAHGPGYAFPQRPVRIDVDWLNYLNPISTLPDGSNNTIINAFMALFPRRLAEANLAQLISYMLLSGLSTIGLDLPWQDLPNRPNACDDCQIFEVNHQFAGWVYTSSGIPVRLAIAIMIAYCTLAVCHIFYLGIFGLSSDSWDTAAEVVALAMNSSPTRHLHNTCSGIYGMKPFRTVVRIIATDREEGGDDHLELVFGDESEGTRPQVKMQVGKEYGSFPEAYHD